MVSWSLLLSLALAANPVPESFPFTLATLGQGPTPVDVGFLSPEPAGVKGPLTIRDGHFYDTAGQRMRFLATNLTFDAAFPPREQAERIAARLKLLGFNLVRFHHIDNRTAPGGLWATPAQEALDPQQLDRLDYFISQLIAHGVWINLNLHVSRSYAGVPFDQIPRAFRYGKILDFYHPRLIEQQKQYASLLLTHRNPYTGRTYAAEPALMTVELNNENTLLGAAFDSDLLALPADLRKPLEDGWHAWLKRRYRTVEEALAAWQGGVAPLGDELLPDGAFRAGPSRWTLEAPAPAEGAMALVPGAGPDGAAALRATLTKAGRESWHFQVHRLGLDLRDQQLYTVEFWARSDRPRAIRVSTRLQEAAWHGMGLDVAVDLTPQWQRFRFAFTAMRTVPQKARLSFNCQSIPGTVELARVSLRPGAEVEKPANASLDNLPAPIRSGLRPQRIDWITYLMEVEERYVADLRGHLRDVCQLRAPVICTQGSYGGIGGLVREVTGGDFVDMHSYHQHPVFPGTPWDSRNWTIANTPLVDSTNGGTMRTLAMHRVTGRPFTVSEYDHPAPSLYRAEMFPIVAAFAARQDWDAVYQFTWGSSPTSHETDRLTGYFNLASDPAKLAFAPAAALLLRGGLLPPLAEEAILEVPRDSIAELIADGNGGLTQLWTMAGADAGLLGQRRLGVRLVAGQGPPRLLNGPAAKLPDGYVAPPDSPLTWRSGETSEVRFSSDQVAGVVGRIGGRTVTAGPLTVALAPSERSFAAVMLVSYDGQPIARSQRLLLVVCGAVVNQDMGWRDDLKTVSNQWGKGPTVAEALRGSVRITGDAAWRVQALQGDGTPAAEVAVQRAGGVTVVPVDPAHRTLWYTLTAR